MSGVHPSDRQMPERTEATAVHARPPDHVQFPDRRMEDPYSARLPLARLGEKSRRALSVGELQMTERRAARDAGGEPGGSSGKAP